MFEDSAWEGFDFGEADWSPAEGMPSDGRGFHTRADGEITHRRLMQVDNVEQVRAIGHDQDVDG